MVTDPKISIHQLDPEYHSIHKSDIIKIEKLLEIKNIKRVDVKVPDFSTKENIINSYSDLLDSFRTCKMYYNELYTNTIEHKLKIRKLLNDIKKNDHSTHEHFQSEENYHINTSKSQLINEEKSLEKGTK